MFSVAAGHNGLVRLAQYGQVSPYPQQIVEVDRETPCTSQYRHCKIAEQGVALYR